MSESKPIELLSDDSSECYEDLAQGLVDRINNARESLTGILADTDPSLLKGLWVVGLTKDQIATKAEGRTPEELQQAKNYLATKVDCMCSEMVVEQTNMLAELGPSPPRFGNPNVSLALEMNDKHHKMYSQISDFYNSINILTEIMENAERQSFDGGEVELVMVRGLSDGSSDSQDDHSSPMASDTSDKQTTGNKQKLGIFEKRLDRTKGNKKQKLTQALSLLEANHQKKKK